MSLMKSIAFVVVTELVLRILIRDNLTLNTIIPVWPMDGIRAWQMVGH